MEAPFWTVGEFIGLIDFLEPTSTGECVITVGALEPTPIKGSQMSSYSRDRRPIRILLADCTKMACQLLADAIDQDPKIKVVAAVTSALEASQVVSDIAPDIVLLGANLDGRSTGGFDLARRLRMIKPELFVVMLLDHLDGASVVEAFRAHASGVFIRDGSVQSLRKCIHSVFCGQVWASTEALRFALEALAGTSMPSVDPNSMALLTRREREVVGLAVDGLKKRDIARRLCLSEHTVKNYLFSIFGKLRVSSRLELTLAVKREWVQKPNVVSMPPPSVARRDDNVDWLQALAEQGVASAQLLLAQLYSEGRGVSQDRAQAYRFFVLAEKSAQVIEISQSERKKLAGEMSREEIAEAERRAASWIEENRKHFTKPFPVAKATQ
jgi:DNA-binding NarL/FixJ family response regulator